jgi:hypothetical protein
MTKVTAQMSVSLDGFYTGPRDTRGPKDMSGWMRGPEAPGFFRVTRWAVDAMAWRERQGFAGGEQSINSEIIEETFAAAGAYVMGRRMFSGGSGPWEDDPKANGWWGDDPPFRADVAEAQPRAGSGRHEAGESPWQGLDRLGGQGPASRQRGHGVAGGEVQRGVDQEARGDQGEQQPGEPPHQRPRHLVRARALLRERPRRPPRGCRRPLAGRPAHR